MKNTPTTTTVPSDIDDYRAQALAMISELDNTASRLRYLTQQLIGMVPLLVATVGPEVTE